MEEIEYLGAIIRRWEVGASTFLVSPEIGARLMNWNISYPDGTFRDIISWPELSSADQIPKARGGNPILFPFSARTFDHGDIHFWQDPTGQRRPMPMHGFARTGAFETFRVDETGFAARFLPNQVSQEAYPYEYDFEVVYRFEEKEMTVELRLRNNDSVPIPWSAGHHFYFNLPWVEGTARRDYEIDIPARKACRHAADGSLFEAGLSKRAESIANPELIDRIHYDLSDSTVTCLNKADNSKIEIEVGAERRPHSEYAVVTWTESDDSPFFCIEPWMGPPNSPETKVGLHTVNPGDQEAFSVTIKV
ncbi:MAG: aldose epimerase [Opitutales bacterium TMED158]|nr:MAG: aldose epimerase [Opitutales bacterium TMED158]